MPTGPLRLGTGPLIGGTGALTLPARSLWQQANFRRLWLANLVSQLGDRIHQLALLWWATETTGSPAAAGLLLMVTTLPVVLLSPPAGWLADRWGRRPAMVTADLCRAVLAAVMAVLAFSGALTLPLAVGVSLLLACGSALFNPAAMAIVPDVVGDEDLAQANSWQELTMQGCGIAGPAVGGLVVAAVGAGGSFACYAAALLVSASLLFSLRLQRTEAQAAEPFLEGMRASGRFLRERPDVGRLLASFGVLNFFAVPVLVYTPYFAKEVFRTGVTGFGLLEAAVPLGMAASALWVARRGEPAAIATVYPVAVLVQAASYLVMGLAPAMTTFLAALSTAGAAVGLINVVVISHFQRVVPPEQLGRFMGLVMTVAMAVVPLSFGLAGVLTHRVEPAAVLVGCGAAMVLLAAIVRRLSRQPAPAGAAAAD